MADPYWSHLCDVDAAALTHWLHCGGQPWSTPATGDKPQRVFEIPSALLAPIYATILPKFAAAVNPLDPMLSRMRPGQSHDFHVDPQRGDWVTRVHVPIVTNPGAWLMFEAKGQRVHFEAGKAYTFNAMERHSFGNDGEADRVHLIFDVVLRGSARADF